MSAQIDFRTMPKDIPSLCIPRVFPNINEARIRKIFDELLLGDIKRVDIISRTTERGEKFNRVFIHFNSWHSNENANMARERLLNGKEIKIIYDQPWFWKVSAYRSEQRSAPREKSAVPKGTPHIQFDTDEEDQKPQRQPQQRPPRQDARPPRQDARPQRQEIPQDQRQRPQDQRQRPQDQRQRPQDARPQRPQDQRQRPQKPKKLEPRSPSSSPPRERVIVKKETPVAEEKKNLVIESEEGELSDA